MNIFALALALARVPEPITWPRVAQMLGVGVSAHASALVRQIDLAHVAILKCTVCLKSVLFMTDALKT